MVVITTLNGVRARGGGCGCGGENVGDDVSGNAETESPFSGGVLIIDRSESVCLA